MQRLVDESAKLLEEIDHTQELNRVAQMKIQQQTELSKILDHEIKSAGKSLSFASRPFASHAERTCRGEARPREQTQVQTRR